MILSCSSPPTDMRSLVPGDALVYLETNDLQAALRPIVDSRSFQDAAQTKPDLSALKGVQVTIVVTGFELSEQKLSEDKSIGKVQPHFVAVADTHAFNYQADAFAREKIGAFVTELYASDADFETSDKNGGKFYKWTAEHGKTAFALVVGSIIYFSNDEASIEKCLAVKRGEVDSFAKSAKAPNVDQSTLAAGYISKDGIAQIANFAAMQIASTGSDDAEAQSAIAGSLPQMIRNNFTEAEWRMSAGANGIEDIWTIKMPTDVADALSQTMQPSDASIDSFIQESDLRPGDVTFYNLKDPSLAWNSVIFNAKRGIDPISAKIVDTASPMLFESYGVRKLPEFLASIGNLTATLRPPHAENTDDQAVVVTAPKDSAQLRSSLDGPFKPGKVGLADDGSIDWLISTDDEIAVVGNLKNNYVNFGDKDTLIKIFAPEKIEQSSDEIEARKAVLGHIGRESNAAVTSITFDNDLAANVADLLSDKNDKPMADSVLLTETRFNKSGVERRSVSDLGFIGWLIGQLSDEK